MLASKGLYPFFTRSLLDEYFGRIKIGVRGSFFFFFFSHTSLLRESWESMPPSKYIHFLLGWRAPPPVLEP